MLCTQGCGSPGLSCGGSGLRQRHRAEEASVELGSASMVTRARQQGLVARQKNRRTRRLRARVTGQARRTVEVESRVRERLKAGEGPPPPPLLKSRWTAKGSRGS